MNKALKKFLSVGLEIGKIVVPQIATVEAIAKTIPGLKGQAKADAVINTSVEGLLAAEGITGKDFVQDAQFRRGVQMVNDGYVLIMHAIENREQSSSLSPSGDTAA